LFAKAEKAAPSVVFIDEIDALGGARHLGPTNNEEREQTLNQLLSCMDGFDSDRRVVVMAATNRYDYLDKALVRPGRFDRIVRVDLPDTSGRADILRVHTRDMLLDENVDLLAIARECQGYSGAELASLANEAAIRAVRNGRDTVKMEDFVDALEEFTESRNKKSRRGDGNEPQQQQSWRSLFQRMGFEMNAGDDVDQQRSASAQQEGSEDQSSSPGAKGKKSKKKNGQKPPTPPNVEEVD